MYVFSWCLREEERLLTSRSQSECAINPPFQVSDRWVISWTHNEREEIGELFCLSIMERFLVKGSRRYRLESLHAKWNCTQLISWCSIYPLHVTTGGKKIIPKTNNYSELLLTVWNTKSHINYLFSSQTQIALQTPNNCYEFDSVLRNNSLQTSCKSNTIAVTWGSTALG